MRINSSTKICMGIGDPIKQSLGPVLHNIGYGALGIDDKFVYVSSRVKPEALKDFMNGARAMGLRGITCTLPHKEAVMEYLDEIDDDAQKIGAVNTIVNNEGILKGYNTDFIGVIKPLKSITGLKGKKAAVIGAGGAAKAFIYGLITEGCEVTVYNRTTDKAKALAERFNCAYSPLDEQSGIKNADIVCNASSVGLAGSKMADKSPVDADKLSSNQIVFDAVYAPLETKLLKDAKVVGANIIHGTEMLLYQGDAQFKLYTGYDAPEQEMRKALMEKLNAK